MASRTARILYVVTEDWYFAGHWLPIARAAREAGYEVAVATRVANHADVITRAGLELHPLRMRRRDLHPWRELQTLRELIALYRGVRPDLVHQVGMKPIIYGTIAARRAGVAGVINVLAGLGYAFTASAAKGRLVQALVRTALGAVLRGAHGPVMVQNNDDARVVAGVGVPAARIETVRGVGVDLERFQPQPDPPGEPVAVFAGRMLWDKGIAELVQAARRLRAGGIPVSVRLFGAVDRENPAAISEQQLRRWHDSGVVQWLGATDDVPAIWAQASIAVLPSYREGLPTALTEAAACARPLVATDVPGCREVVRDGVNGFLVPPRDPDALAEAIRRLAGDAQLRARFGRAGRALVEEAFSRERVVDGTLKLYARVLGERAAG